MNLLFVAVPVAPVLNTPGSITTTETSVEFLKSDFAGTSTALEVNRTAGLFSDIDTTNVTESGLTNATQYSFNVRLVFNDSSCHNDEYLFSSSATLNVCTSNALHFLIIFNTPKTKHANNLHSHKYGQKVEYRSCPSIFCCACFSRLESLLFLEEFC